MAYTGLGKDMSTWLHRPHRTWLNLNVNDGTIIQNLFVPPARTFNYGLKQLRVTSPRIWNSLPNKIKNGTPPHIYNFIFLLSFPHFISSFFYDLCRVG